MKRRFFLYAMLVLVVAGAAWCYRLLRLQEAAAEQNLFALVPADCAAVVETDEALRWLHSLQQVPYAERWAEWELSDLLRGYFEGLEYLSDRHSHGLSRQLHRVAVSFHEPHSPKDQVLYCRLAAGDEGLVEAYLRDRGADVFPPRQSDYRGETLTIYPLSATDYLVCFRRPGFLVLSLQKRLVEQVVDAYLDHASLWDDTYFRSILQRDKVRTIGSLYVSLASQHIAHWVGFDLRFNPEAVYLAGTNFDPDTCQSFTNALLRAPAVPLLSGKEIPRKAYAVAQLPWDATPWGWGAEPGHAFARYLKEVGGPSYSVLWFAGRGADSLRHTVFGWDLAPEAVRRWEAEWHRLIVPGSRVSVRRAGGRRLLVYAVPPLPIASSTPAGPASACFYRDRLWVAPSEADLLAYVEALERGEVKEGDEAFDACYAGLADESCGLMWAYMDCLDEAEGILRPYVPAFFRQHAAFFRHFWLVVQFTRSEGVLYPTFTLRERPS